MKPTNAGKVRKRVVVRGKKKAYSRVVMVRAQQLGMRAMHRELKQERAQRRAGIFGRLFSRQVPALNSHAGHTWVLRGQPPR